MDKLRSIGKQSINLWSRKVEDNYWGTFAECLWHLLMPCIQKKLPSFSECKEV